ncbi:TRAP transporter permease [Piscinibacter sakaiensis]|uniref:TRAP transporter permease n=1 Tax=Piscinibacter sakaiensis TaxID=1547922 RepID=UPI003AB08D13
MSNAPAAAEEPSGDALLQQHDPLAAGFPAGTEGRLLFWWAFVFSSFQIITAAHILDLPSQIVRAVHVGFLLSLVFPLMAAARRDSVPIKVVSWVAGLLGVATAIYQWVEYNALIIRAGDPTQVDIVVGVVLLVLLFVATWRVMGPALPIISGIFLGYCLFGQYLPSPLNHRGYDFTQVIDHMAFGTEGVYGIPTYVSSSYIFLFILFGSFLERAGMITLFTDIALGLFGSRRGGPAKVAVVASGMMGTISGSGVANVVTTGQFTIPLMKRFGYRSAFAGGVEATASMGGQIMPPVMGAVAFIMAETLDVPYASVVKAAVVPAVLYFMSAFWMVHLEAGRANLSGLPADELPSPMRALTQRWYLILPLVVLVVLLFSGYTPLFAGTVGLALTVMLILGGSIALGLPSMVLRVIFWIGLGLVAASFAEFGMVALASAIVVLIAVNVFRKGGRATLAQCRDSLSEGAKTALPVGIACAIVGIIIGTMTLTGAANTFGQFVVAVGKESLFLSLVLTMLTCLVLGMGIPTIPNYIITSSIAGPALLELGVPLLVTHMFVFYFGIMADLTPPVALACFAAAPIAKERGLSISIQAIKVAAAGFVIPFMAVYSPALMLQPGGPMAADYGLVVAAIYIIFKALLAIGLWGAAVIGYLKVPMSRLERLVAAAAAITLIAALPLTDEIGFVLAAIAIAMHWRRSRSVLVPATRS